MAVPPDERIAHLTDTLRRLLEEHAKTRDADRVKQIVEAVRDLRELIARLEREP